MFDEDLLLVRGNHNFVDVKIDVKSVEVGSANRVRSTGEVSQIYVSSDEAGVIVKGSLEGWDAISAAPENELRKYAVQDWNETNKLTAPLDLLVANASNENGGKGKPQEHERRNHGETEERN